MTATASSARKAGDEITLFSRSGLDWTVRFPAIAKALLTFPAKSALIDGEVAFVLPSGVTDFKSLQEHIDSPHGSIRYFVFDLLSLDGKDWRKKPLKERRAKLAKLMAAKGVSEFSCLCGLCRRIGAGFFAQACAAGLEGIMSKRADAPYRSGRGRDWLKIKCTKGEEFVIGGYSRSDVRGKPFSSLLLGTFDDGRLIYAGKVGTGFDSGDFESLAREVRAARTRTSPFVEVPRERAQGRGVARAQARRADRVHRADARRPAQASELQGLARGQAGARGPREQSEDEEAGMAKTKRACKQEIRRADVRRHHADQSRPGLLPGYRPHQARRRPLLRDGRAVDAALRGAAADQPGALPGRNRQGAFLPAPRHEGHEQGDQADSHFRRREQEALSLYRRRGGPVRAGADRHARDPRLGRVARPCRASPTGSCSISIPTRGSSLPR